MNRIVLANDAGRVGAFLQNADKEFVPPLSQRVDLLAYSRKLATYAENFFVTDDAVDKAHAAIYVNRQDAGTAFLSSICVLSRFRSERVSQPLLEACCKLASDRGMHRVSLEVARGNRRAIDFYVRLGFEEFGDATAGNMLMARDL